MQSWDKSKGVRTRVGVLLFDGFSNHCLANAVEPMRAANTLGRATLYDWEYLTVSGAPAISSSGLRIVPDAALRDAGGQLLLIMPSYGVRGFATGQVTRALRSAAGRFDVLVGLDMGSWLLAHAGLLSGLEATIHWEELTAFAEAFPDVATVRERFVIAKNRITCSGAMAAFDLVLHLMAQSHGPTLALEVEQLFMARGAADRGAVGTVGRRLSRAAVAVMQENLEAPLTVVEVSRRIRCSQRKLEQAVRTDFATTPQQLYLGLRLALARRLAEATALTFAEIALRSGYRDASAMTRAFRGHYAETPGQARRRANGGRHVS